MARFSLSDYLQNHAFWLLDTGPIRRGSLPVLTPLYGFSSISAPSIEAQKEIIRQANSYHGVPVVTGGEEGSITLRRGASFGDIEFYRWILAAITGNPSAHPSSAVPFARTGVYLRRNLLLLQFFPRIPFVPNAGTDLNTGRNRIGSAGGVVGALLESIVPAPFEGGIRIPARGWLLKGCVPVRYRAGSDFDANDASVSLMELELLPEKVEEINLGA